jgi:hypothetical protein
MSGRPVQLLAVAAVAAAASFASVSAASAGCYSGCGYSYAPPVAYYSAPIVYSYSYAAPVRYAAPCSPCGYGYAARPMFVVNQGPAFTAPVTIAAEPTPAYDYGYRRSYPSYYGGGVRWHRHWKHRWGHRGFGPRFGYGPRRFHRGFVAPRYRMGAVVPGYRMMMRRPHHFRGAVPPRMRAGVVMPRHMGAPRHIGPRHMGAPHRMGKPGSVQPMVPKKLP